MKIVTKEKTRVTLPHGSRPRKCFHSEAANIILKIIREQESLERISHTGRILNTKSETCMSYLLLSSKYFWFSSFQDHDKIMLLYPFWHQAKYMIFFSQWNENPNEGSFLSWSFKTIMNLIRYPFFNWDSGKHRSKWNVLSTPKVNHKKLLLLTYTGHGVWVRNKLVSEKSKLFVTATNPIPHSRWCRNITLETRTYEKTRILTKEFLSWSSNEVLKSAGQGQ